MNDSIGKVKELELWTGPVMPQPIGGGMTNANFLVHDDGCDYFVRVGDDVPVHGILRSHEVEANKAAFKSGISPNVIAFYPGVMVLEFIRGKTLAIQDIQQDHCLDAILSLIQACHRQIPRHFCGYALIFWVFNVIRNYAAWLTENNSRKASMLPDLMSQSEILERAVGPVDIVFGHNDLLAANFIDDGERLWLIDFDYAGFNSPLFDLGGLASNNSLKAKQEVRLLETYFGEELTEQRWISYQAMKCASLLRESMWSMVSEIHSEVDFDYRIYTEENLDRYQAAMRQFMDLHNS